MATTHIFTYETMDTGRRTEPATNPEPNCHVVVQIELGEAGQIPELPGAELRMVPAMLEVPRFSQKRESRQIGGA